MKTATFIKEVFLTCRAEQAMFQLSEPFEDTIWKTGSYEFVIVSANYTDNDTCVIPCDSEGKVVYPGTYGINTPLRACHFEDALKSYGYEVTL